MEELMKRTLVLLGIILMFASTLQTSASAAEIKANNVNINEQESNDTPAEADSFQIDNAVFGAVDNLDVDFFVVDIGYTGNFILSGHGWNSQNNDIENYEGLIFSLIDQEGNLLAESEYYAPDANNVDYNIIDIVINPGTYYIAVENLVAESEEYAFYTELRLGLDRLAGNTRYSTAVSISEAGWDASNYAVITTGGNFPDALSATPLAKKYDAPLLLTEPNIATLNTDVKAELQRLNVKEVFIVGGTVAVSAGVEQELVNSGITVTRIDGINRYETAINVAEKIGNTGEIAVVTGSNFADALSMSAIAASKGMPIILTEQNSLPSSVSDFLSNNSITKSYVIGGTSVISDSIKGSLPGSERVFGADRYATNKAIIDRFAADIDFSFSFIATGGNYPDAISGSALAAKLSGPIILSSSNPSTSTKDIIQNYNMEIGSLTALGGSTVVPDTTVNQLVDLANPYISRNYLNTK
jgi:putative cell wall-binding protein